MSTHCSQCAILRSGTRGRAVARGGDPHPGIRGGAARPLRGAPCTGDRGAVLPHATAAVRLLPRSPTAPTVCPGRPRRGGLAQGDEDGGVLTEVTPPTAGPPEGPFPYAEAL